MGRVGGGGAFFCGHGGILRKEWMEGDGGAFAVLYFFLDLFGKFSRSDFSGAFVEFSSGEAQFGRSVWCGGFGILGGVEFFVAEGFLGRIEDDLFVTTSSKDLLWIVFFVGRTWFFIHESVRHQVSKVCFFVESNSSQRGRRVFTD